MAITYNTLDGIYYGTNAERLADTKVVTNETAKFFEYDTDTLYVTDGTTWHVVT